MDIGIGGIVRTRRKNSISGASTTGIDVGNPTLAGIIQVIGGIYRVNYSAIVGIALENIPVLYRLEIGRIIGITIN